MNILFLASCTSHKGGLEVMTLNVAQEMKRRGHGIVVAYAAKGDAFDLYERFADFLIEVPLSPLSGRHPLRSMRLLSALYYACKTYRVDVCFSSNLGLCRTTGVLKCISGTPIIYHVGIYCDDTYKPDWFTRWGLRQITHAITPSELNAHLWRRAGIPASLFTICPNWVSLERFKPELDQRAMSRARLGISMDQRVVIYVGRLTFEKGIDVFFDALRYCHLRGRQFTTLIIGAETAEDNGYISKQKTECLICQRDVRFLGLVNNTEEYYAIADIAVIPARGKETFGLTLIEAMASGLLTIASNGNSFPQIIGEENSDLLFPVSRQTECAELLDKWLSAPIELLRERGIQLRSRVAKYYSPTIANVYEQCFADALKRCTEAPLTARRNG